MPCICRVSTRPCIAVNTAPDYRPFEGPVLHRRQIQKTDVGVLQKKRMQCAQNGQLKPLHVHVTEEVVEYARLSIATFYPKYPYPSEVTLGFTAELHI